MAEPLVLTELDSQILTITLNRPEKRNALNGDVLDALSKAFEKARDDRDVRGILLRGEGKAFSAGIDAAWLGSSVAVNATMADFRTKLNGLQGRFNEMEDLEKPIVAAIQGHCVGLGLELALACDFRIAEREALVGLPEVRVGLIPDVGGTTRLLRTVGPAWAKEIILTGRLLTAGESHTIGLVNHVVDAADLLPRSRRLLSEIARNAPLAVGLAKRLIDRAQGLDKKSGMELEALAQSTLLTTEDFREGATALMERRDPKFQGR
ncbi:MAG: enoyl-CoA hydratase/isomerase family protein [Deltaproteobacteria bacterium]|nr:enoyl-CoA hydratase/isomerase family protein [Deltaproteobacteria bacterium]